MINMSHVYGIVTYSGEILDLLQTREDALFHYFLAKHSNIKCFIKTYPWTTML